MMTGSFQDTIVAIATPGGTGGIAVLRLSGPEALNIADKVWSGRSLREVNSHTAHLGQIINRSKETIDSCVATVFRGPKSFTGEDTVEFSVHGSPWIQQEVIHVLCNAGARVAQPGEFSRRAFLNGRLDLAQAEGVADLIAASSRAAHRMAITQTKGAFSEKLNSLRSRMIDLASLLELELDFSEEDVEFADREKLKDLCLEIKSTVDRLADSFRAGKVFKEGIPVVIAGAPNAGKSTLLNALLEEDKAIVSDIPGTTRDIIEDTAEIGGILFRFVDTAGLHNSDDEIEKIGISRARQKIESAAIVIWLIDATSGLPNEMPPASPSAIVIPVYNKVDRLPLPSSHSGQSSIEPTATMHDNISTPTGAERISALTGAESISALTGAERISSLTGAERISALTGAERISALTGAGIDQLKHRLIKEATKDYDPNQEIIVANARHHDSLRHTSESLTRAIDAIDSGISADFIAQDVREAIHHIGAITGAITTDTLLLTIFSRFCIGK